MKHWIKRFGVILIFMLVVFALSGGGATPSGLVRDGEPATITLGTIDMEMVYVPGGTYRMGEDLGTAADYSFVTVHDVTLDGFSMGKYEVTQEQWQAVMGSLPAGLTSGTNCGRGGNYPVYHVSWYDAVVFCNKLSMMEGLSPAYKINGSTNPSAWGAVPAKHNAAWNAVEIVDGSTGYRLPTEAQWEYAAKGGDHAAPGWVGYTYSGSDDVNNVGWNNIDGSHTAKLVGGKAPNALGLYDMTGNVFEWCWDWYDPYISSAQTDPSGPAYSLWNQRVVRGGGWNTAAVNMRSISRNKTNPSYTYNGLGFRVVRP